MRGVRHIVVAGVLAVLLLSAAASAAGVHAELGPVAVHVEPASLHGSIWIGFSPHAKLPRGGYFYAVVVLGNLILRRGLTPSCAISSDMRVVEYGYPHAGRVRLALPPASSVEGQWCEGGEYLGAVYAVPHKPPCSAAYPCYRGGSKAGGLTCGGQVLCGLRAPPRYHYPGGLPKPVDPSTRIVGRFKVLF